MFFPIRTDARLTRVPWVNYTLIGLNLIFFLLTYEQIQQFSALRSTHSLGTMFQQTPAVGYWLWPNPEAIGLHQFISYQFLHVGWQHLIFNMLFLFVFGNAVEDRLGPVGYVLFYLAGGVIAGVGHVWLSDNPVLGASGAVAAVTGAYLALFPLSNVTIAYWLIVIIGSFEVSSIVLILFRVIQDAIFQFTGVGNTAYMAHLAGYGFGFAVGMALLVSRLLAREPYDMLALIEHQRRRWSFKRLARRGYQPWESHASGDAPRRVAQGDAPPGGEAQQLMRERSRIADAVQAHDLAKAAPLYEDLLRRRPEQVMSQQVQLDLANQFMAEDNYGTAARAYELFLKSYPGYSQSAHIQLILGLIYARYLLEKERARELLTGLERRLEGDDRALAKQVLAELG